MAQKVSPEAEALLGKEFKVLDHGLIRLVDFMGSDAAIVQAARVSYGAGTTKKSRDRELIRYLLRHRHTSPLEMVEFKFHVKLPIFVARQWIRHRTANVNEYSGRYSIMKEEFYVPPPEDVAFQSTDNKQGRSEEEVPDELKQEFIEHLAKSQKTQYQGYSKFIDAGLAREIARIDLPLSLYTEWYWKIDLHNLLHFLRLRMDKHAQKEIREYANIMADMVKTICPAAYEAFVDFALESVSFTGPEIRILKQTLSDFELPDTDELKKLGLSKMERFELREKLENIKKV
ncbi:MAG: FAD-dependent thymidylate synthase [bacterium]|nr:FAD-dependent thymidylate synthase [bacterium]